MRKRCLVYRKGDLAYVFSQSVTEYGIGIAAPPMIKVLSSDPIASLGEAVLRALDASRENVPHPEDLRASVNQMTAFVRARTWNAFADGASLCEVLQDGSAVELIPGIPEGKGVFRPDEQRKCTVLPTRSRLPATSGN